MKCPECSADTRLCQCAEAERDSRQQETTMSRNNHMPTLAIDGVAAGSEFPFNFSSLASVGDVIKVTSHPSFEPRSHYIGTVLSKTGSTYLMGISEANVNGRPGGEFIGSVATIHFGMLDDWADRITLVRASGSSRAIEDLSKALDGAKSLIDGMLQRDEIQQAKIAKLHRELAQRDRQAKEAHDHLVEAQRKDREIAKLQAQLVTTRAAFDSLQRNALTVDMVAKQRDDALREVAAMREDVKDIREERNRLREQFWSLNESREKILSDRNFLQGQMEKAQADYRDLRLRMLKA